MSNPKTIAEVDIIAQAAKVKGVGFGLPLLLSPRAAWVERVRSYSSIGAVANDFATNTPEYLAAAAYFAQDPEPESLLIGRCAGVPTLNMHATPVVHDNYTYKFQVQLPGGAWQTVSFTSGAGATALSVNTGLKAAFDALGLAITTSLVSANATLQMLANAADAWFGFKTLDLVNLPLNDVTPEPGTTIATDVAAILLERSDFYAIGGVWNSKPILTATAAVALANHKFHIWQSIDGDIPSAANTDVLSVILNTTNKYSGGIWKAANSDFADWALLGARLPTTPGGETWKFATLLGVPLDSLTDAQIAFIRGKNGNYYDTTAGLPIFQEGTMSDGSFMDFVRYLDFLAQTIQGRIIVALKNNQKVPMTDGGIGAIEAEVRGSLKADETRKPIPALTPGSSEVIAPKAADVSQADRTARLLQGLNFSTEYATPIHKVKVNGVVTV